MHSTEEKTRKFLLGIRRDDKLLDKISFLTRHGIELHAQIVLCPGVNDGEIFRKTVTDLKAFYPGVKSVAVVPLGLTQYRQNLTPLRMHTKEELQEQISVVDALRKEIRRELDVNFVYLADEFFIKAGAELPAADYYDEFYQIENGVGEFRDMIDTFRQILPRMRRKQLARKLRLTWVTGTLAAGPLEKYILNPLRRIKNLDIAMAVIENRFYGASIGVSGLLTSGDIYEQLRDKPLGEAVLLPPRVLNDDDLFLDNGTVDELQARLGVPCHVLREPIDGWFDVFGAFAGKSPQAINI